MKKASTAALAAIALAGCGDDAGRSNAQKAPELPARFACSEEGVKPYRHDLLSISDEIEVCNSIQASEGKVPSVQFFQDMSKAVAAFKVKGSKDDARELSYQLMNVIEARGQSGADDATKYQTINMVFKMFNGWNGRITPRDVNVFLRNSGPLAHMLSDDGLVQSMAMVMENKKAIGL
ncbi:hypothetical protein RSP822_18090 [Ralstonia solanacearum]|uniref:hypothetical protein n=1 Tax=Ralstonia solanacearum TaxID=305 RepID=UPI000E667372|nr:hypothetical protein [Ralstonia solanacearum]RIJ84981.1 hypothetical protein RSP822_18090 [Ralstonia solanacearum]